MIGKSGKSFNFKWLLVFFVPLLVLILALMMKHATGPYWLGPNSDPSYQYLINSLHVLEGKAPSHFEHPGTTLQILGAAVFKVFHLSADNTTIVKSVLNRPEFFLSAIFMSMLVFFVLTLVLIGVFAFRKTKSIVFVFLLQSMGLVFCRYYGTQLVLPPIVNINPEMLLIIASHLSIVLVLVLYFKKTKNCLWESIVFGVVCALGIVSKTTFIPLLLLPILLLPGVKNRIIFIGSFLASAVAFLFPARGVWSKIIYGFKGLAVHKHRFDYGEAEASFINVDQFVINFLNIFKFKPFWLIAIFASVVGMIIYSIMRQKVVFENHKQFKRIFNYILVLTVVSLGQILIVSKHYGSHYLIPGISLIGALLGFYYLAFQQLEMKKTIVSLVLIVGIFLQVPLAIDYYSKLSKYHRTFLDFSQKVHRKYENCQIISHYRSSSKKFALFFGDAWGGKKEYADLLKQMYPGSVFYLSWDKDFRMFDKIVYLHDVDMGRNCVVVYGTRGETFDGFVDLHEMEFVGNESVSRIKNVGSTDSRLMNYASMRLEREGKYRDAFFAAYRAMGEGHPNLKERVNRLAKKVGFLGDNDEILAK